MHGRGRLAGSCRPLKAAQAKTNTTGHDKQTKTNRPHQAHDHSVRTGAKGALAEQNRRLELIGGIDIKPNAAHQVALLVVHRRGKLEFIAGVQAARSKRFEKITQVGRTRTRKEIAGIDES